jgi:hypothetical protein
VAYTIPTGVPTRFAAGTTLSFKITQHQQFPVSESWTYKLHLTGKTSKTIMGSGSGSEYTFTLSATDSALLTAGIYHWVIRASKATEVYKVSEGTLEITADAAVTDNTDARSFNEKMRDALRTLIYGNGTLSDVEQYQIHGRQIVKMSKLEREKWLNIYETKVLMERNGGRLPPVEIGFRRA